MNSENSKISKWHVLILKLINKLDLRIGENTTALSNLSIYYTWKNSVSDIQNYFEYILKKHGEDSDKPSVQIYKIGNKVTSKIENGYSLLTLYTTKLLGSIENKITNDKNGENMPHLQITEVVLV